MNKNSCFLRGVSLISTSFLCMSLLGCSSFQVSEKNFLKPDVVSGFKAEKKFDGQSLRNVLPRAQLQELSLTTPERVELQGLSALQENLTTSVLYFGGNMFHIDDAAATVVEKIGTCPSNVSMYDYRGYGRSKGEPTIENMKQDALRIYDQVRARTQGKLLVHGHSLGSFMAAYVAQQRAVDGVILESTASNALDWANANVPWYARPFVTVTVSPNLQDIDNVKAASLSNAPALVMVGADDSVTPQELGLKVFNAFSNPKKKMLVVPNVGHNSVLGSPQAKKAYCAFVADLSS